MNGKEKKDAVQWRWRGELTIQRIAELKQELKQALATVDHLLLDLSEATQLDAACLQLLCSAHRSATTLNKQLQLTGLQGHAAMLRGAGFVRHIGCALDCNDSCVWLSKEPAPMENA